MVTTNQPRALIAILFLIISTLIGCPEPCNDYNVYNFAITAYFTPEKDSIQIGDTLYLTSEFPSTITPQGKQNAVDYSQAEEISFYIRFTLGVVELVASQQFGRDAVYDFTFIEINGKAYNDTKVPKYEGKQQMRYQEDPDKYRLKVGLIPKRKDIYSLGLGGGFSTGRRNSNECDEANISLSVTNSNPHLY